MACANEEELLFMAKVQFLGLDHNPLLKELYEPASVLERIQSLGPFQRVVMPSSLHALETEMGKKDKAFANMTAETLLKAWEISENSSNVGLSVSHHILRISPSGNDFAEYTLMPASDQVVERLRNLLLKTDIEQMRVLLEQYNSNPKSSSLSPATKGSIPSLLEGFFVQSAATQQNWTNWKVATSTFTTNSNTPNRSTTPTWEPFSLNVNKIDRSKCPTHETIVAKPDTIFYMSDPVYPFVDFFWYDATTQILNAGQASVSFSGHGKSVDTFNLMKSKLEIPDSARMIVNMIPLPIQANSYASGPPSKFFLNAMKDAKKISDIQKNVEFRVIAMDLSSR
ncbi:Aste57867_23337 [Aphanomyces stellatus]|uniref:Aste57867_22635 protein n=1 Tax=Aphanomyces stellatus TaxID=120398 RepID=A0A485LNG8_9STRA|nr:hypothetical protein As57867_023266 [Aphanomyces stellatus]KAF0685484.1 hypothetical protein As57867_022565 [Aphanomyces stellatus]VFT99290.1 Aste57867_22635 [Aphanomyces stellatus]VFT99982.1 Aste57867_23337 [Aphanomyces stellatus]